MKIDLQEILARELPGLPFGVRDKIEAFQRMVCKENQLQNLTRLSDPKDFFFGHVLDCNELVQTRWLSFPAMDLGSGVGVPGILSCLIGGGEWVLAESEGRKAEYLLGAVNALGLDSQIRIHKGRAEEYLREHSVGCVVARAVGRVAGIYSWIRKCSTWNTLILFKGPRWDEEWVEFQRGKFKLELEIKATHEYLSGDEEKIRKIICLQRVPRGTFSI